MKRSALRLGMRRLGGTFGGRLAWLGAFGVALVMGGAAVGGQDRSIDAVRVACWVAAGPIALAAARAPALRDRSDGVELLAATHGIDPAAWGRVRVVAAALSTALRVLVPTVVVATTVIIVAGSGVVAARALAAVVASALAGALIGLVAAACGEIGAERGRSLFAAVVLVPWMLGDLWSVPALSLVGAVDAGLSILAEVAF